MKRRAFIKRASGLLVPLAFPAIIRAQGIPEPILSLMNAPSPAAITGDIQLFTPTIGGTANNFTGPLGVTFTWGAVSATCTQLGRYIVSGDTATHVVELMNPAGCALLTSAIIVTNGAPAGSFQYTTLASPFTLAANATYFLFSIEVNGGDSWLSTTPITFTSACASAFNANSDGVSCFTGGANTATVIPNLKYHF